MSSEIDVARRLYDAFAARDPEAILASLHPEFVGEVSAGMPLGLGGRHEGPEAMLREVWAPVFAEYEMSVQVEEMLSAGPDRVVALGRYRGTGRRDGFRVDAVFAHVLGIGEGRIRSLRQITDTASWS